MKNEYIIPGERYSRLTIIEEVERRGKNKRRTFLCRCNCGNEIKIMGYNLKNGHTTSCGCIKLENNHSFTHGDSTRFNKHYLYRTWQHIKDRCYNPNDKGYKNYGGRGIIIYKHWKDNYIEFKNWIFNNLGERPEGYSLDRIENNSNYEPNNLRWANRTTQNNNRRNVKKRII